MSNLERRFGKYAIRNLSLKLIILYAIGYLIVFTQPSLLYLASLDPYAIIHGQVWRIVSWLLVPPASSNLFFVVIMLFFYYSIGTSLENVWGTWRYNVFIGTGILLTVVAAFLWMGGTYLFGGGTGGVLATYGAINYFRSYSMAFSTYYINMGIFLAYAMTFPEAQVLLFFIIPIKVKYLGILDAAYLLYSLIAYGGPSRFVIAATLVNVLILWWKTYGSSQRRRNQFKRNFNAASRKSRFERDFGSGGLGGSHGERGERGGRSGLGDRIGGFGRSAQGTLHRCAICGRTEADDPNLEFRYCSKCEGGYEYCSDHLFTHVHVHEGEKPHMMPTSQV